MASSVDQSYPALRTICARRAGKDPPGEDEGGSFPGRPAGAAASKAELKASVLLSGPEIAAANLRSAPADPHGPICYRGREPAVAQQARALRVFVDLADVEALAAGLVASLVVGV